MALTSLRPVTLRYPARSVSLCAVHSYSWSIHNARRIVGFQLRCWWRVSCSARGVVCVGEEWLVYWGAGWVPPSAGCSNSWTVSKMIKWSRYRPGVTQRVGRGVDVLFHDRGTRRGWVVSSTLRPQFTPGEGPVPILQEAGWAPGLFWTGGKSRPHRDSIPDRPARSQSLYRLSYQAYCV